MTAILRVLAAAMRHVPGCKAEMGGVMRQLVAALNRFAAAAKMVEEVLSTALFLLEPDGSIAADPADQAAFVAAGGIAARAHLGHERIAHMACRALVLLVPAHGDAVDAARGLHLGLDALRAHPAVEVVVFASMLAAGLCTKAPCAADLVARSGLPLLLAVNAKHAASATVACAVWAALAAASQHRTIADHLFAAGVLNAAIDTLRGMSGEEAVVSSACTAMANVCLGTRHAWSTMPAVTVVPLLLKTWWRHASAVEVARAMACTLACACSHDGAAVEEVAAAGGVALTVAMLRAHAASQDAVDYLCRLLACLSTTPTRRREAREAGVVPLLTAALERHGASSSIVTAGSMCNAFGAIITDR